MHGSDSAILDDISITELLEHDDRPTLVLDLSNPTYLQAVYSNRAASDTPGCQWGEFVSDDEFRIWIAGVCALGIGQQPKSRGVFFDREWICFALRNGLVVIQCVRQPSDAEESHGVEPDFQVREDDDRSSLTSNSLHDSSTPSASHSSLSKSGSDAMRIPIPGNVDWLRPSFSGASDYIDFLRKYNWAATPLGPIERWGFHLRTLVHMIMSNPDPRIILWGPEFTFLYNEACVPLIGQKHPAGLGGSAVQTFAELWDDMSAFIDLAMRHGQATKMNNFPLTIERRGFLEETYWAFNMIPIIGEDGSVVGSLIEFTESTNTVVAERRLATIARLKGRNDACNTLKGLWSQVLAALESNVEDVPFALLYSVVDVKVDANASSTTAHPQESPKSCALEGLIGIREDHPAATPTIDLFGDKDEYAECFRDAWRKGTSILLESSLPQLLKGLATERDSGIPCKSAVITPIPGLAEKSVIGFLIFGMNPRRPYDEDYQLFIRLLSERLGEVSAAIFIPEEQKRSRATAEETALRHALVSQQLLARAQEAERGEAMFTRLAHLAPVGVGMFRSDGSPVFINDAYLDITGFSRIGLDIDNGWKECVLPEDVPFVESQWSTVVEEKRPALFEYRLKRPWKSFDKANDQYIEGEAWLSTSIVPELNEDGTVRAIMGWLTDISHQKWSEKLQAQRLEDALETKRQSEKFIDMTSHEIRNPLSAIIQSADAITTAFGNVPPESDSAGRIICSRKIDVLDSAQTILLCALHQKRIGKLILRFLGLCYNRNTYLLQWMTS